MDKSAAKFLIPAGLAVILLVVLRAQNQSPTPPSETAPAQNTPRRSTVRPRTVALPPPPPVPTSTAPAAESTRPATPAGAAPAETTTGKPAATQPAPPISDIPRVSGATPAPVVETPSLVGPPAPGSSPATPRVTPGSATPGAASPGAATPATPGAVTPGAASTTPGTPTAPGAPRAPRSNAIPGLPAPTAASLSEGPVIVNPPTVDSEAREIEFTESAMDIGDILDKYEVFTGRSTLRDGTIQGTMLPLRSNGMMTRKQAAEYIKAFLLLNGYSIIPSDIRNVDKVIPTARGPQLEQGARVKSVYTDPRDLPESDQIINYVLYLKNIGAEEAQRSLTQIITPSRQGGMSKITPVPAAGALILTDTVPAIRLAIALQERIDVPSAQVVKKFFRLDRADAEEVAQVLTDILAAQTKLRSQASGGGAAGGRNVAVNVAGQALQQALPPGAQVNLAQGQGPAGQGGTQPPDESTVIVKAITRTNEVLISGRPSDIKYLEGLIHELDKEAKVKNLKRFQLRFIRVEDFLEVAQDAIGRGTEIIQSTGGGGGARRRRCRSRRPHHRPGIPGPRRAARAARAAAAVSSAMPPPSSAVPPPEPAASAATRTGGGAGGAGGGLNRGRSSATGGAAAELFPASQVVGKTLLISEPRSNTLLVAGPPEHLIRIDEVLREMDVRPLQVSISAVIAEVTLTDTLEHGIDILRKVESVVVGGQDITYAGTLTNIGATTGIIDPNVLSNVAAFQNIGNGLNLYGQLGEYFNVYIKALEQTGRVQVIARPFIFTANNKEADISIGRRIPVPASSQSSVVTGNTTTFNTNIEYEDVNLELLVTPLINSKDEVTLTISQTNDDVLNFIQVGNQSAPQISQQTLDTEVAVPNGGVAVIGGLIREKDNADDRGLPWITRVPILRDLLGHARKAKERSELLIFIQPRIVGTSEELEAMHTDHVRRTVIGKKAETMAQPPLQYRRRRPPHRNRRCPARFRLEPSSPPSRPRPPPEHRALAATRSSKGASNPPTWTPSAPPPPTPRSPTPPPHRSRQPRRFPAPARSARAGQTGSSPAASAAPPLDTTIPNEKRKPAFWEKPPAQPAEKSNEPDANNPKSPGLKRLLPWNWGKKQKSAA